MPYWKFMLQNPISYTCGWRGWHRNLFMPSCVTWQIRANAYTMGPQTMAFTRTRTANTIYLARGLFQKGFPVSKPAPCCCTQNVEVFVLDACICRSFHVHLSLKNTYHKCCCVHIPLWFVLTGSSPNSIWYPQGLSGRSLVSAPRCSCSCRPAAWIWDGSWQFGFLCQSGG